MRLATRTLVVSCAVILGIGLAPTSSGAFDVEAYLEFLDSVEDQTARDLIAAHSPFGPYLFRVPDDPAPPEYLDAIIDRFSLTSGEQSLLDLHGFMVSERLAYPAYGHVLEVVWHADLPVFVSTDAILHALHRSYVDILAAIEREYFRYLLATALITMHENWTVLDAAYGDIPGMRASVDDVDVYLTVARSLLAGTAVAPRGDNQETVDDLLGLCHAEMPATYPLFNDAPRLYDFSQLKPRGHYTESPELQRYFRCMMWLGRTELRLTPPTGVIPPVVDVSREIIDAYLIRELVVQGGSSELSSVDSLIRSLVGDPDNVTLDELDTLAGAIGLTGPDALLDPTVMDAFETELASGNYTAQGINSQILIHDPMDPEGIRLPYAFLLMGQRFIIDSYVTGNVVFDAIHFEGQTPFRGLPHPFDVLFALGNDDVLPFLVGELQEYHYAANLSALRYLIDGYEPEFWRGSLYSVWLQAIRTLSMTGRDPDVPDFMRTGAWQQEKMNTQLTSWTELRHDNLLYAKQSYTGGSVCSYPRTYIEPVPAFYRTLEVFAADAAAAFSQVPYWGPDAGRIGPFFANMQETMNTLAIISDKELSGEPFTAEELDFLSDVLYFGEHCVPYESGWYRDLFFSRGEEPTQEEDLLIADVHTQPTDEGGTPVGHVLHVATGRPNVGVFIATPPGQPRTAFVGPVGSFHEYVTANFQRLTDEEWEALYEQDPPTRPNWTYVYLADANGDVRDGPRLVNGPTPALPEASPPASAPPLEPGLVLAPNRPNPFNPSTTIGFRIDLDGRDRVSLRVFDVQGSLVATLLDEPLASGAYFVRWNGQDASGRPVPSGTYLAELRMGALRRTQSMILIK